MEMKSVSGLTLFVDDLTKTAKFYKALGFRDGNQDEKQITVYLNWFSLQFVAAHTAGAEFRAEADADSKGDGIYINIKVEDVDEFYKAALEKGLKPSSEPRDWPWGNREFVIRDPDGYKLVFFNKT